MPRLPRIHTRAGALVEIVNRTFQGRHLIKPGAQMNALIVGALAKAQEKHPVKIYSGAFASNHWHLQISADTVQIQANFLREFTRKLSIESGKLYDWQGTTFPKRYHAAEVSQEPEAQIGRLTYHLRHGCKENLVDSPLDWPGVSFAEAMITGQPLKGIWIDRSAYYRASQRGEDANLEDFTEHLELTLAPLPCWEALDPNDRRRAALDLIRDIEYETAARHGLDRTASIGAELVTAGNPHYRPPKLESSPQPYFHALSAKVWKEMREALFFIVAAYREAADRLWRGDFAVAFPENTFPPARLFVQPAIFERLEPG